MSDYILNEFLSSNLFPVLSAVVIVVICVVIGLLWGRKPAARPNFEDELLEEEAASKKKNKLEPAAKKKKQKKLTKPVVNGQTSNAEPVTPELKPTKVTKVAIVKSEQSKLNEELKVSKPISRQQNNVVSDRLDSLADDWKVNVGKKKQKGGKKENSLPPATPPSTPENAEESSGTPNTEAVEFFPPSLNEVRCNDETSHEPEVVATVSEEALVNHVEALTNGFDNHSTQQDIDLEAIEKEIVGEDVCVTESVPADRRDPEENRNSKKKKKKKAGVEAGAKPGSVPKDVDQVSNETEAASNIKPNQVAAISNSKQETSQTTAASSPKKGTSLNTTNAGSVKHGTRQVAGSSDVMQHGAGGLVSGNGPTPAVSNLPASSAGAPACPGVQPGPTVLPLEHPHVPSQDAAADQLVYNSEQSFSTSEFVPEEPIVRKKKKARRDI